MTGGATALTCLRTKLLVAIIGATTCGCAPDASEMKTHRITYEIDGDDHWPKDGPAQTAAITIRNASGGSDELKAFLPHKENDQGEDGRFLYVSARAQTGYVIECKIYVDGVLAKYSISSGQFSIATCDLRL